MQRRLLGLAGFLSLLLIGLVVFHALHTGSTGLNAVAEAAQRTARQPGARLALEVTYAPERPADAVAPPGMPTSITGIGTGAFNARTGRTRATLSVPVAGHGTLVVDSVGDSRRVFVHSSAFAAELPPGVEWLGMEPMLGHDTQTAFGANTDAKGELQMLEAVGGGVDRVDKEIVRGHLTTRYKTEIKLSDEAKLFAEAGETEVAKEYEEFAERMPDPIPVEAWIDGRGLVRQIRLVEKMPTPSGPALTMDMRVQFFDFGSRPKITLPPKRRVLDFTPVLRAELGLDKGNAIVGAATNSSPPLNPTTFRKRVAGICRKTVGEAKRLFDSHAGLLSRLRAIGGGGVASAEARSIAQDYGHNFEEPADRIVRRGVIRLAAITAPPAKAADYERYVQIFAMQTEWSLAQARALELGSLKMPGLEQRKAEAKAQESERKRLAAELGIGFCERESDPSAQTPTA